MKGGKFLDDVSHVELIISLLLLFRDFHCAFPVIYSATSKI